MSEGLLEKIKELEEYNEFYLKRINELERNNYQFLRRFIIFCKTECDINDDENPYVLSNMEEGLIREFLKIWGVRGC